MAQVKHEHFENTITSIACLSKTQLTKQIKNFKGRFKLDFTDEYLQKQSEEKLRHVLLAAMLNAQ